MPSYCRKSPFPEQPIKVLSPPCPCDKCKEIRDALKPIPVPMGRASMDMGSITDIKKRLGEICGPCGRKASEPARACGKKCSNELAEKDSCAASGRKAGEPGNPNGNGSAKFFDFVYETIGIIAFFVIATTMFWLAVGHHGIKLIVKIYKSNRRTQVIALSLLGLLVLSISHSLISKSIRTRWRARRLAAEKAASEAKKAADKIAAQKLAAEKATRPKAHKKNCPFKVNACNSAAPPPVAAKANAKPAVSEPKTVTQNVTITITDSEAKEIFKKSKLYAIPTEMKQPPALLVYLRDVVLTSY